MKRIDSLLVEKKYFPTRQKAQYAIKQKSILVEGEVVQKPSKLVEEDSKIEEPINSASPMPRSFAIC